MYVDCVAFCTSWFLFKKGVIRERWEKYKENEKNKREKKQEERERERKREREREKEKEQVTDKEKCLYSFLLLAPGSAQEQFAEIPNLSNKPTKVNWTLSWPSALEICGNALL